jgi:hypothetical protein
MKLNWIHFIVFSAALSLNVLAHPGHDVMAHGPAHIVSSPFHLGMLLVAAFAFLSFARFAARPVVKRLFFGAATLAIAAMIALAF